MANQLSLNAPAKINFALDILGVKPNGYHQMRMINHACDLSDRLTLKESDAYSLISSDPSLPTGEDNLITKAVRLMEKIAGRQADFTIELEKQIPSQAGLGGGSSDAAAALKLINAYWKLNLSDQELEKLGVQLGADVPYCIQSGLALVEGIGEELTPIEADFPFPYLIVIKPNADVSTPKAFSLWDEQKEPFHPDLEAFLTGLNDKDTQAFRHLESNAFYAPIHEYYPQIQTIREELANTGADFTVMSGSGSTLIGYFRQKDDQEQAYNRLLARCPSCFIVKTEYR